MMNKGDKTNTKFLNIKYIQMVSIKISDYSSIRIFSVDEYGRTTECYQYKQARDAERATQS